MNSVKPGLSVYISLEIGVWLVVQAGLKIPELVILPTQPPKKLELEVHTTESVYKFNQNKVSSVF